MGRHTARTRFVLSPVRRESDALTQDHQPHRIARRSTFAVAAALTTMALTTTAAASLSSSGELAQETVADPATPVTPSATPTPAATPTQAPVSPEVSGAVTEAAGTLQEAQRLTETIAVSADDQRKIDEASAALRELVSGATASTATTLEAQAARSTDTASRSSAREAVATETAEASTADAGTAAEAATEPEVAAAASQAAEPTAGGQTAASDLAETILDDAPLIEVLTVPDTEPTLVLSAVPAGTAAAEASGTASDAATAPGNATIAPAETVTAIEEATAALQALLEAAPTAVVSVTPAPPTPEEIAAEQAKKAAAIAAEQAEKAAAEAQRLAQLAAATAGYPNGQIPESLLCGVSFAGGDSLRCDAAAQLDKLNVAFRARFGRDIAVSDMYRSYAAQVAIKATKGSLAATPGTSNHGLGLAVDLSGGIQSFGTAEYTWMRENAPAFGWDNPDWARPGGANPEAWHWEYTPAG